MKKNTKLIVISLAVIFILLGIAVFFIQRSGVIDEDIVEDEDAISEEEELLNEYVDKHDNKKVIEAFKNSEEVNELVSLALAYAEEGLREQEKGGSQDENVNKSFEVIGRAMKIDSNNSEVYRAEGYAYEIKPDLNKAIIAYNKAIEIDEGNLSAYVGKGHVYRMQGALDLAVEEFNKVSELDSENEFGAIYLNLCSLEVSRSNFSVAKNNCEIIINSGEEDVIILSEAYQLLSSIYMEEENYVQSREYLVKALSLFPNDSNLFVAFSRLNFKEEKFIEAEKDARKSIEISPIKSSGYLALSRALYMQGEFDEAIKASADGVEVVDKDVSLLESGKPAFKRDLYYVISHSHRNLKNVEKQKEFEQKAIDVFAGAVEDVN